MCVWDTWGAFCAISCSMTKREEEMNMADAYDASLEADKREEAKEAFWGARTVKRSQLAKANAAPAPAAAPEAASNRPKVTSWVSARLSRMQKTQTKGFGKAPKLNSAVDFPTLGDAPAPGADAG